MKKYIVRITDEERKICEETIRDLEELRKEVTAWFTSVNASQPGVSCYMTVADARCKLKYIHPKILV